MAYKDEIKNSITFIQNITIEDMTRSTNVKDNHFERDLPYLEFVQKVCSALSGFDLLIVEDENQEQIKRLRDILTVWKNCWAFFKDYHRKPGNIDLYNQKMTALKSGYHNFINEYWLGPYILVAGYQSRQIEEFVKNIENMNGKVFEIQREIDSVLQSAKKEKNTFVSESQEILEQIKTIATASEVTKYEGIFKDAADNFQKIANWWLLILSLVLIATVLFAINADYLMHFNLSDNLHEIIRKSITKVFILTILTSCVVFLMKLYRTNRNLSIIYKHKADAISTFQEFVNNAKDSATKDFVLQETTRAIFNLPNTGLVENDRLPIESGSKIFEIIKNIKP